MSRHTFQHGDDIWTVSYDQPLRSFYAQVEPRTDLREHPTTRTAFLQRHQPAGLHDPDELLLTVAGDTAGELPAVSDPTAVLAARNVPCPDVPAEVRTLLEPDQLQAVDSGAVHHGRPPPRRLDGMGPTAPRPRAPTRRARRHLPRVTTDRPVLCVRR
jgi:hypothetical protein